MSERREKVKTIHKKDSITYTGNPKNSPVSCVRENKEKHSPSEIFHDIYRKSSPVSCVRENKENILHQKFFMKYTVTVHLLAVLARREEGKTAWLVRHYISI